ncbi:hypothetical protein ACEWUY_002191 [Acinetobacter baumannii]|uniref:Uncharacterized protein n=1 Tax=Acinetobacter baumannii TaxID=470 RepID=A0AAX0TVH1_ACIBA|nr:MULTISPECIES: hypothetical protein [Acinetobacter]EGY5282658.1 hypothetical protein [Acinetobacter baumannii]EHU1603942.1 hypothetical protein [Acinetobacter baumannii]EHU2431418.1 hypothetical protein [Acinetobacter baumannii]EHU2607658.1 hypothetical protein [Acinetobacter baumannii]EHU2649311.1 hypothetical protein [Acinetobacter baumannii]
MNVEQETILLAVNDLKKIAEVLRKHKEFQLAEIIDEYIKNSSALENPSNQDFPVDLYKVVNTSFNLLKLMEILEKVFNDF